jgi:hypothetical protein
MSDSKEKLIPGAPFLMLGMGPRRKMLYCDGALRDARSGETLRSWAVRSLRIVAAEHRVEIEYSGGAVKIWEDEDGVWLEENGRREALSSGRVTLPRFEGHAHAPLLRTLHAEILVNIVDGRPLPNYLVYDKPWYRDAAMMCMCLERTGNLALVAEWIMGLREPFDLNNKGHREPDNLGQLLYMISLVSDASHPLVETILQVVPEFGCDGHISGISDYAPHPVYQTKWLKFGLRALGLNDPYRIPPVFDSYSALFWMDFRDQHVEDESGFRFSERDGQLYPYLRWAKAHFYGELLPMELTGIDSPLTWEAQASEAEYSRQQELLPDLAEGRIAAPHTWHAAEMFFYLLDS